MSHPVQEEDRIATGKIILTAVVSLIIFGIGVLWAVSIQRTEEHHVVAEVGNKTEAGKPEVGIVYQTPFFLSHFGQNKLEAKRAELESYGWVDKNAKLVHIPIEEAMKKYVATAATAAAAAPAKATAPATTAPPAKTTTPAKKTAPATTPAPAAPATPAGGQK